MRVSPGVKLRILGVSAKSETNWLNSAIYRQAPTVGLSYMHANRYTYRSSPDAQKSLLQPKAKPNRKSAILNNVVIFGVSHMSYFDTLSLQDASDHLQNRCVSTRLVGDYTLLTLFAHDEVYRRTLMANLDVSP